MADSPTQATLKQALTHIKNGDSSTAIRLIRPIIREDRDNAAAWFLLANATSNTDHQKKALEQVLRLKPGDSRAQKMLTRIAMGDNSPGLFAPEPVSEPVRDDPFDVLDAPPDPFGDDPFDDNQDDYADIDAEFASDDDPFADVSAVDANDPFKGIPGLPVGTAALQRNTNTGGSITNQVIITSIVVVILAGVGILIAAVLNADSTGTFTIQTGSSRSSTQGTCSLDNDSGYFSEMTVEINCGSIETNQRWRGTLHEYQVHDWYLTVNAGQQIDILVEGIEDSDTTLELWGPNGDLVAENDDLSFQNLNSQIEIVLRQPGTYKIRVGMFWDSGGDYEINVGSGT